MNRQKKASSCHIVYEFYFPGAKVAAKKKNKNLWRDEANKNLFETTVSLTPVSQSREEIVPECT